MKPSILLATYTLIFSSSVYAKQTPLSELNGMDLVKDQVIQVNLTEATSEATVLVFLSARCPCSNSHEGTLEDLSKRFPTVRFVGIHSNSDEPANEAQSHFKNSPIHFPMVQDKNSKIAEAFGAFKTPHVFVISKSAKILYQGGVDDSHQASQAGRHYLADALTAIREGKEPEVNQARTLGCAIERD